MDAKKRDIDALQDKEKILFGEFQALLGDNNKWGDFLTKVFKKRIKRSKKKKEEEEGMLLKFEYSVRGFLYFPYFEVRPSFSKIRLHIRIGCVTSRFRFL